MLLAGELLKVSKTFVEDGIHPQVIVKVSSRGARATDGVVCVSRSNGTYASHWKPVATATSLVPRIVVLTVAGCGHTVCFVVLGHHPPRGVRAVAAEGSVRLWG